MAAIFYGKSFVFGIPESEILITGIPACVTHRVKFAKGDFARVILRWPDKSITRHVIASNNGEYSLGFAMGRPTKPRKRRRKITL